MARANTAQAPAPRVSTLTLANVKSGKIDRPMRVLLFGVEGIGKSTFGSGAPKPVFLGAEDGTAQLDVDRLLPPERRLDWQDMKDFCGLLANEPHKWQTLVVDTLDWCEPLIWDHICKRDGMASIESYGYGKGYSAALDEWRVFLELLELARLKRGMHVVLLAHSWIKKFANPQGEDFDRYEMKLNVKASGLLKEWSDCVLFADYETFAKKDEKTKRVRGFDTGARMMYTQRRAAFDAKNRYDLPEALPLSWEEFEAAVKAQKPGDPMELYKTAANLIAQLTGEMHDKATAHLGFAGDDATRLAKLVDWVTAKLAIARPREDERT